MKVATLRTGGKVPSALRVGRRLQAYRTIYLAQPEENVGMAGQTAHDDSNHPLWAFRLAGRP